MKNTIKSGLQIWTIGHSTRTIEDFGKVLRTHSIETLVDVRSFPGSRRYPHFNREALSKYLFASDIKYVHSPLLGGRRKPQANSHNTAWKNEAFRAYADYMETEPFEQGVRDLLELASASRVTVMCAELLWWRCHRSLISDFLKSKGISVQHILDEKKLELHPYTAPARIVNGELSYRGLFDGES